ncbi:hypothetical protein BGI41_03485 [Methanobrevibacter sp. 87.7]|uniref:NTP transferase domain-containing protein n=1 Tax=Methanobrevibacter sp. 87.7 TaxID=387957 RepID=UPI000B5085BA|nr:NTP transferase domain-containing protein [Methanobrevibacter sp. 87.7]OWT33231.1 hypothetical protein BGI41_03485 [Methanobrevibacter sp. 87.7]
MIIALIMAGGLGTRLNSNIEKPLFKFNNKHLIDYVLENISLSDLIDKIVVAVSSNTLNTKNYLINNHFACFNNSFNDYDKFYLNTPGKGYLNDLSYILSIFEKISKNNIILIINADLPFIKSDIIDYVIAKYLEFDKPSLSVQIPVEVYKKYNVSYNNYEFNGFVPSGLNILKSENSIQEQTDLIMDDIRLAFNLNSIDDVDIAYKIMDYLI